MQYNDQSGLASANLRFGWLQQAGAGFFVVYNEVEDLDDRLPADFGVGTRDRSLIIKYSRLFDLLR